LALGLIDAGRRCGGKRLALVKGLVMNAALPRSAW
jgi:hypothetical protein